MAGDRGADDYGGAAKGGGGEGLDAELDRAVSSGDALAYIVVSAGDQPGRVFVLNHNTILIGRVAGADVSIMDPSVSAQHARIINGSAGFEIEDLRSTNGTLIGGRRITRAPLRNGDRVTVGSVEFMFLLDRPTSATVQLPAPKKSQALVVTGGAPATLIRPGAYANRPSVPMSTPAAPFPRLSSGRTATGGRASTSGEDEGLSMIEIIQRLARLYYFVRPRLPTIAACLAFFLVLGFFSSFALPPRSAAVCQLKLLPQVKLNPVDEQYRPPDDQSETFFQSPERAFGQGDLVRDSLTKLEGKVPTDPYLMSVASRLKLDSMGDHLYRVSFTDKVIGRGHPQPLQFLPLHIQGYIQSEIAHALRQFNAKVSFLRDQVKAVEADLARINEERTRFREANTDRLPEDALQTHTSRFQLDSRRADLLAQVRRLQADLDASRLQVQSGRPLAATKFQSSQTYRDALGTVNRKISEGYASGMAEGHPEIQQLKAEKERLEALVKGELEAHATPLDQQTDPAYQAAKSRIEGLQAQLSAARSDLADTDKSLAQVRTVVGALPRVEQRMLELTNAQEATTKLRGQLFEKLKQAELQLNLEQVSVQSRYEIGPVNLERPAVAQTIALRCGLGLFVGLFFSVAWLLAREGRRLVTQALVTLDNNPPRSAP